MKLTLCREPFEYIIVDNTYTDEEIRLIFLELDFWNLSGNLLKFEHNLELKNKNTGLVLDNVYTIRNYSNVLKFNRKIYEMQLDKPSTIINYLKESKHDTTLISYHENEAHYTLNNDYSVLTAMTYLYKQPKAFEGGDLILSEYGYAFEPWFNRTYIMPGLVNQEVTETLMKRENCGKGLGRYCITNFIK